MGTKSNVGKWKDNKEGYMTLINRVSRFSVDLVSESEEVRKSLGVLMNGDNNNANAEAIAVCASELETILSGMQEWAHSLKGHIENIQKQIERDSVLDPELASLAEAFRQAKVNAEASAESAHNMIKGQKAGR